ncbi:MAG TPA: PEP-CTERM sorting domain-containing protein [Edaphobacter sp.]|nr:PEP-CTERM sorting domain-containing protein [Edaphobacter sp.]
MNKLFLAAFLVLALSIATMPAHAGNIALTGHDDDYHCSYDPSACGQLADLVNYARNGSSLPVLTFDASSELTDSLTGLGIAYTNVNPNSGVTAAMFDHSLYSAFVVASDYTCGGCDNSPAGEANIAAQSAAIEAFLNAGGGIVGLAGGNSAGYYDFVPQTATSVGGAPSDGYTQTAAGAGAGIHAVNGDATHNLFFNPGTHGESGYYQIAEINNLYGNDTIPAPAAVTLICTNCSVSGGVITGGSVPEPSSFFLLGSGLLGGLGMLKRRLSARL